ncbi:hypothetical protein PSYAC_28957, partial [Pseudomonas syringae pv. actinidiae str. M302091]
IIILNRRMIEFGDITGVVTPGIVTVVIIGAIEKQADMQTMTAVRVPLLPPGVDPLAKNIFLGRLFVVIGGHHRSSRRQTTIDRKNRRSP